MASPVVVAAVSGGRKRQCPQCKHWQSVSLFLATEPVPCHRCATMIPPPKRKPKSR